MSEWDDLTKTLTIHRTGTETSVPILVEHKEDCIKICVDDGFTDVPDNCFGSYPYLESIQLPDSIKSLGNNIFSQTKIKTFHIPFNCEILHAGQPFDNQYFLEEFTVDDNQPFFSVIDGALYSKNHSILYFYPSGKKSKICVIPYCVQHIFCAGIGWSNNIEIIVLPPSIKRIESTFGYKIVNLKRVIVLCSSNDNKMKEQIDWNDNYLFRETQFTYEQIEWTYSSTIPTLSSYGTFLTIEPNPWCKLTNQNYSYDLDIFKNNDMIKTLHIFQNVTNIGDSCFSGCKNLQHVSFPETILTISNNAFSSCNKLFRCSSISYPISKYEMLIQIFPQKALNLCTTHNCNNNSNKNNYLLCISIILFM